MRKKLVTNWTAIVSIPDDGIGIYAKSDPKGETMAGIAVLISDGDDVILANIVREIPLGKVLRIATRMNGKNGESLMQVIGNLAGLSEVGKESDDTAETQSEASDTPTN